MSKSDKDFDLNLSDGEMLNIVMQLWVRKLITCSAESEKLVLQSLGLYDFDQRSPLLPDLRIEVDDDFVRGLAAEHYLMIVKPPKYFSEKGTVPSYGLIFVNRDTRVMYVLEESVNYLRKMCNSADVELVEQLADEPTYVFRYKS